MTSFFESILNGINNVIGNYGWSVVVFTLLVRLVLLPLDIKSKKSMRAMSKVQPKMQELQVKYAKDKDKLNQKMSELYKKEHVNPLMGCLPMLIQLPILFIMFAAMRNIGNQMTGNMLKDVMDKLANCASVDEVGGIGKVATEGWLWIKNIFQPDSFGQTILPSFEGAITALKTAKIDTAAYEGLAAFYNHYLALNYGSTLFHTERILFFSVSWPTTFEALRMFSNGLLILPVFAGLSQWLMTKITSGTQPQQPQQPQDPNNPNPMNSGMMKWFFPLFSVYICITSNAAFAVYWAAANVIAIVQQVIINWYFERKDKKEAALAAEQADNDEI